MNCTEIKRKMLALGLSPRHKGFYYIYKLVIELYGSDEEDMGTEFRRICSELSDTAGGTERCIRYAINYAWDVAQGGIREMFKDRTVPPVPIEFVLAFCWEIQEADGI